MATTPREAPWISLFRRPSVATPVFMGKQGFKGGFFDGFHFPLKIDQ